MNNNTILYYNKNATNYFNETYLGDMSYCYNRFLRYLKKSSYILDFGCGSGRDSKYFLDNGYKIKAIDGSKELCNLASNYLNQEVECMEFKDLNDKELFDGIWACASLLHIPKEELLTVIKKMIIALKLNGYIYMCLKNGYGEEIDSNGKYYCYYTKEEVNKIIPLYKELELIEFWTSKSTTNRNEKKYWNNFILKKVK